MVNGGGLCFNPKNEKMKGGNYLELLKEHMLRNYMIHTNRPISYNCILKKTCVGVNWECVKYDKKSANNWQLIVCLKRVWCTMKRQYFGKLAKTVQKTVQNVVNAKGGISKYLICVCLEILLQWRFYWLNY